MVGVLILVISLFALMVYYSGFHFQLMKLVKDLLPLAELKLNEMSIVNEDPAIPEAYRSYWASAKLLASYEVILDSGSPGLLLPATYARYAVQFQSNFPYFGPLTDFSLVKVTFLVAKFI